MYRKVLFFLITALAQANVEYIVKSIHDGQLPYLVVFADQEGGSKREPGIYAPNDKGEWRLILPGQLIRGGAVQGILAELPLTQVTKRYECLTILDKKLVLVQIGANVNRESSYIILGGGGNGVVDPLGNEIKLPEIKSTKDISVFVPPFSDIGQKILISIKSETPFGDGITFALVLDYPSSKDKELFSLVHEPIVLEHKFMSVRQLSSLVPRIENGSLILSPLAMRSLARKRKGDSTGLLEWKHKIQEYVNRIHEDKVPNGVSEWRTLPLENLPLLDLATGKITLQSYPVEERDVGGFLLLQALDPFREDHGLIVVSGKKKPRLVHPNIYTIRGQLDVSPESKKTLIGSSQGYPEQVLVYLNGEPYYIDSSGAQLRLEEKESVLPEEVNILPIRESEGQTTKHYLLVSRRYKEKEKTELFILSQFGTSLTLTDRLEIFPHFLPQDQFYARVRSKTNGPKITVLFDNYTPPQKNLAAYRQAASDTTPAINLKTSSSASLEYGYMRPLETIQIGLDGAVQYLRFEQGNLANNQSGIYFGAESDTVPTRKLLGELLKKSWEEDDDHRETAEWSSRRFVLSLGNQNKQEEKLSVVILDSGFQHGKSGFQVLVLATTVPGMIPLEPTVVYSRKFSFSIEYLDSVQLIMGSRKFSNQVSIVFSFKTKQKVKIGEENAGAVEAVTFEINSKMVDGQFKVLSTEGFQTSLAETLIPSEAILSRVRFDVQGRTFWVETPELSETDKQYRLRNLQNGDSILTASGSVKMLDKDNDRESIIQDEEYGNYGGNWEVYSEYGLERRWYGGKPPVPPFKEEELALFPGLIELLDDLSDPTRPPRKEVFIVSEELLPTFDKVIKGLIWSGHSRKFNFDSGAISFFAFDINSGNQRSVIKNLEIARKSSKRPIFFANLGEMLQIARPGPKSTDEKVFEIEADPDAHETQGLAPHLLYWIATEGEKVGIRQFKERESWNDRVSTIILSTPKDWQNLSLTAMPEVSAGLLKRFHRNTAFLASTWRLWPPETVRVSAEIKQLHEQPTSGFEQQVFPNLAPLLETMTSMKDRPRHRMLVVPQDLKPLVRSMILALWASKKGGGSSWNYRNKSLILYLLGTQKVDQNTIIDNFDAMRDLSEDQRAAILVDIADVKRLGRVSANQGEPFKINDFTAVKNESLLVQGAQSSSQVPHALYWLEAEGLKIQPKEFVDPHRAQKVSVLYLVSPEELASIQQETQFEERFQLSRGWELVKLEAPSHAVKLDLLSKMLRDYQIRNPGLIFDFGHGHAEGEVSPEEARTTALTFLINRSETLAAQRKRDGTSAFILLLNEFSRLLVEDLALRKTKKFDRNFVERLVAKVYNVPLNLQILPEDDYLRRFNNERQTALDLAQIGYEGPLELKLKFIRLILSQTRPNPVRTIPSSAIVYGDTSTGKTYSFIKLCELAGRQLYDFNNPNDENASAFILKVESLVSQKGEGSLDMTVDEALAHLKNFLSLPHGYRGWILIDDLHKGDKVVIKKLITFIQTLFDTKDGLFKVSNFDHDARLIPVRNLFLEVTLNPIAHVKKLMEYRTENGSEIDKVYESIIATLSSDDFAVEKSFLARFGLVLNLSQFPLDAKAPKLTTTLREGASNEFAISGQFFLISTEAVNALVHRFPKSNARDFLSEATQRLLQAPADSRAGRGKLILLVPRTDLYIPKSSGEPSGSEEQYGDSEIAEFIRDSLVPITVNNRIDGQLKFTSVLLAAFRTSLYESLLHAVGQDIHLSFDPRAAKERLVPLLHGITGHFIENPSIPIGELGLDPHDYNLRTSPKISEFASLIDTDANRGGYYFPLIFSDQFKPPPRIPSLLSARHSHEVESSRAHVMTEFSARLAKLTRKYLSMMLRVESLNEFPGSTQWLASLTGSEPKAEARALGKEILETFDAFYHALYAEDLVESRNSSQFSTIDYYDVTRLFLLALDKGITGLPWGRASHFIVKSIETAADDTSVGSGKAVLDYFFANRYSILRPATQEGIIQLASSSESYRYWDPTRSNARGSKFKDNCEKIFSRMGSK